MISAAGTLSVIVPVLNEAGQIHDLIEYIRGIGGTMPQVIVVDGDENGSTIRHIGDPNIVCTTAPAGRGRQMNAGAQLADGDVLLFLHADTRLPADAFAKVAEALRDESLVAGAFDLDVDNAGPLLRWIVACSRLRNRLLRVPYGDQAIFLRRDYFRRIGGFREIPIMEDVDLMLRIRRRGDRIRILRQRVRTSARRWHKEGIVYTTLRNGMLRLLFCLGVNPERLARWYRRHDE